MANSLSEALFRIDPTEGLLQYVQEVKPYHSKVLDVFVEYVYSEKLSASMRDRLLLDATLMETERDVLYTCGFGYLWSPYNPDHPEDVPSATIIKAQALNHILVVPTVGTTTLTVQVNDSGFVFSVNDPVVFITTGSYPTSPTPLLPGVTYYIKSVAGNEITVSSTIGGTAIKFNTLGTGLLHIRPINLQYDTFLVDSPNPPVYDVVVADLNTDQLVLATPFPIVGASGSLNRVTVTGNLTTAGLVVDSTVYINGNTDAPSNGRYTVASLTVNGSGTQTTVTFREPLSLSVTGTGRLNVPLDSDSVPFWPAGAAVKIASTNQFPSPVISTQTYYFNPTEVAGLFNLSYTRYPQQYTDIVNLTTLGVDQLTVHRTEPFVPGDTVVVSGSYEGHNDRVFSVTNVGPEGSFYRVSVLEHVVQTTPASLETDGIITYTGSFGDTYCAVASSPDLYTAAFFAERLQFIFGPTPVMSYLLDTFSGLGDLSTHTVDSGHQWSIFQLTDSLSELVLTDHGTLTTSDTDIWARSNWAPTDSNNFAVEVDLYVKEAPATGSPYFRMFAKETDLGTFYGPYIDISPDPTTNMIQVETFDGDGVINSSNVTITSIPVNNIIKVKLQVINGNHIKTFVNGSLVYTSANVTYPTLSLAGFNFRVPAGDPTQFELSRIYASS